MSSLGTGLAPGRRCVVIGLVAKRMSRRIKTVPVYQDALLSPAWPSTPGPRSPDDQLYLEDPGMSAAVPLRALTPTTRVAGHPNLVYSGPSEADLAAGERDLGSVDDSALAMRDENWALVGALCTGVVAGFCGRFLTEGLAFGVEAVVFPHLPCQRALPAAVPVRVPCSGPAGGPWLVAVSGLCACRAGPPELALAAVGARAQLLHLLSGFGQIPLPDGRHVVGALGGGGGGGGVGPCCGSAHAHLHPRSSGPSGLWSRKTAPLAV